MKKLIYSTVLIAFSFLQVYSQIPKKFNYQGVLRNTAGELVKNTSITVRISLLDDIPTKSLIYSETHTVMTNNYGQFMVIVGNGSVLTGEFSQIDWSAQLYQKTEIANPAGSSYVDMGLVQLIAVPYSLYSEKAKVIDNSSLYFTDTDTLFAVKDREGNIVFAVFPDGAKVYTPINSKGNVGGFAVSGRTLTKQGEEFDYFRVTPDSTRIYVNDSIAKKGSVGGFAVSGRTRTKGTINDYLFVTADSTRIYVNDTLNTKGNVGGFAVSGRTLTKGEVRPFTSFTPENYLIGHRSGSAITTGRFNSYFGYEAGFSNSTGNSNIFQGFRSGYSNTIGSYNIFLGDSSGVSNTSGEVNIFMGYKAGASNTTGNYNILIGDSAGVSNTTGIGNVFVGNWAGYMNTTGERNVILGVAGYETTTGIGNVFLGTFAGTKNHDGNKNIYIGDYAGFNLSGGQENVFLGKSSGWKTTNGNNNVFLGAWSGNNSDSANYCIFIGPSAGWNSDGGWRNVFIGPFAGYSNLGNDNVFIGNEAGYYETTSNKLYISNSSTTTPLIYGEFDNAVLRFNAKVNIRDFMVLEPQNAAPTSPAIGTVYFDNNDKKMKVWDGTTWQSLW